MAKKVKEPTIVVNLTKKVKMKVTEKGAEMGVNKWKTGDVIEVGEVMSEYFRKSGVATILK